MYNNNNISENRIRTDFDETKQTPNLLDTNITAPQGIGIFDEPTRCYKINLQWAKIFEGWVSWMTSPAFWANAIDDNYIGCIEMQRFLVGENCGDMCMNCEELKACFPTIPQIQQLINYTSYQYNTDNDINFETYNNNDGSTTNINYNQANYLLPPAVFSNDQNDPALGNAAPFCDRAFGAAMAIRDYMHGITVNWLATVAIATNEVELFNDVIGLVPAAGEIASIIGVDSVINLLSGYADYPLQSYETSYTVILSQDIACGLLCAFSAANKISLDVVANYLRSKLNYSNLDIFSVADIANNILLQSYTGDDVVYALWLAQIETSRYLGIGNLENLSTPQQMNRQLQIGQASPSNVWSIQCSPCDGWEQIFDFTNPASYDPAWLNIIEGTLTNNGLESATFIDGSNQIRAVLAELDFSTTIGDGNTTGFNEHWIEYTVEGNVGGLFAQQRLNVSYVSVDGNSGNRPIFINNVVDEGNTREYSTSTFSRDNSNAASTINYMDISLQCASGSPTIDPADNAIAIIKRIGIRGTSGINPFTLDGNPC